ncbi:MAG: M23 family metallopeptidase [Faecalibacterium prausnitzii]
MLRTGRRGGCTAYRSTSLRQPCLRCLHADGSETLYAHLQYLYVRPGEVVQAGQPLGTAGADGRATGAHLHFELSGRAQPVTRLLLLEPVLMKLHESRRGALVFRDPLLSVRRAVLAALL